MEKNQQGLFFRLLMLNSALALILFCPEQMVKRGKYFIGTSGWQYKHWKKLFYPENVPQSKHFSYYMDHFDTVELNNPFYRLPEKDTFKKWRSQAKENFIFAVKANRFITHMKKLKDPEQSIERMLDHTLALKEKLGPVLFQLPPGWNLDKERLQAFLKVLPRGLRYTIEFRNSTWYDDEIFHLLERFNIAFCIYELEGHLTPLKVTSDFVYVRLHGPGAKYSGNYEKKTLNSWAKRCSAWLEDGKDVYVYFDNDQAAYAVYNALTLKATLDRKYGDN